MLVLHSKQEEVETLIKNRIPVLLEGPSGSGKTTIFMKAAAKAEIPYSFISGTRQTTVSHIIGFMNVNGVYAPSPFRKAYVEGHYFNIDEMDAMDSNVLLIFNSLENNIMYFPDGYTEPPHENFRFMATANPQDQHQHYVGRNKLDAATLDRFDQVMVERDPELEKWLVDEETLTVMDMLRKSLDKVSSSVVLSMRDSIRYQKRKGLNLLDGYTTKLLKGNQLAIDKYAELLAKVPKVYKLSTCRTMDDLIQTMHRNAKELRRVENAD